jgi:hypothetical protein
MTDRIATPEQIAAAAAALELGQSLAREHWTAASETPGVGWQVNLPSMPDALGRLPEGEGFNLPADSPALSSPAPRRLVPDYGAPAVGGAAHHSTQPGSPAPFDGVSWPSPSGRSSSSIAFVSPRSKQTPSSRIRKAARARARRRGR